MSKLHPLAQELARALRNEEQMAAASGD
jgi:hypothetical protein